MKTILFNSDQIYKHGGIERVTITKANYFSTLDDVKVVIVTTEQNGKAPCYPLNSHIQLIDLGINYDREKSYFNNVNLKKAILHYKRQSKLFYRLHPDVIISPNYNFDHYWLPFIKRKAKLIKERHGSRYFEYKSRCAANFLGKIKFLLQDWLDSKYDHIVVLNQDEKTYVKSNNVVVIPNPIEKIGHRSNVSNQQVIAAGRISPVKGFDNLIAAWKLVAEKFPHWQLHIYGDNYLGTQERLQSIIEELGLEKAVLFKESVSNIPITMLEYSIYAMTSETECFPMVLLEALSVGVPIVSYDCPNGPRNIISHMQDGILVKHKDIEDFANQLMYLIANEAIREEMGKKGFDNSARFYVESVMKYWEILLNLK